MALSTVNRTVTSNPGSDARAFIVAVNALLTQWDVRTAQQDADATITDADYTTIFEAAAGIHTILDQNGRTISA